MYAQNTKLSNQRRIIYANHETQFVALYGTGCARGDYNLLESLCNCKNQSCKDYTAGVVGGGLYVCILPVLCFSLIMDSFSGHSYL